MKACFLQVYHKYDCLQDHRLDKYKNRDTREIGLYYQMEIDGLLIAYFKKKIKTNRTTFKKRTFIGLQIKKSGMPTDEMYVP